MALLPNSRTPREFLIGFVFSDLIIDSVECEQWEGALFLDDISRGTVGVRCCPQGSGPASVPCGDRASWDMLPPEHSGMPVSPPFLLDTLRHIFRVASGIAVGAVTEG